MKAGYGLVIPETLAEAASPSTTAVIIYDMQVGILKQLSQGEAVLKNVLPVLHLARNAGVRIFFMRHLSLPKKLADAFQLRQMMTWQRETSVSDVEPWFLRDSPDFALAPELKVREDEAIFDKITMSAFEGTPLAIAMRDCGCTSFVICGVAMEIGIDPTVRHGADLGLIPIVVTDACGAGHPEAAARSIENIKFMGDAILCDVNALAQIWNA
jgi:nicotinamidase-related amidase